MNGRAQTPRITTRRKICQSNTTLACPSAATVKVSVKHKIAVVSQKLRTDCATQSKASWEKSGTKRADPKELCHLPPARRGKVRRLERLMLQVGRPLEALAVLPPRLQCLHPRFSLVHHHHNLPRGGRARLPRHLCPPSRGCRRVHIH